MKYREYSQLDLTAVADEVLKFWDENDIFKKSMQSREGKPAFTFFEGPPSANGMPGIHHVLGRTIKDIFCRYKTLQGYKVARKGGWDTHGLPVELQVEQRLGLKKEDIGEKISVADYNKECRQDVMKFKSVWDDITRKIGFWLDLDDPYITYEPRYIETLWSLIKRLHDKGLLYKGYTIQPYSPAAGTGLSSHELNQPGCYKNVKDTSATAQFKIEGREDEYFLAWTTTPWTLPANVALAVGPNIDYVKVHTFNPYTNIEVKLWLAKSTLGTYFSAEQAEKSLQDYQPGDKVIPYKIIEEVKGEKLVGLRYEQLLPYVKPDGDAFKVIAGDFVTTEDGTGIVHIAPTFGADDFRVAKENGIDPLMVPDPRNPNNKIPIVDTTGKFVEQMGEFAGRYVKDFRDDPNYIDVNIDIVVKLKQENRAFKVEKYEHNYPHCWRTDKPVIYYPLQSWFIKTTAYRDKLISHNNTINWKPKSTGTGRFGNWLENLVDWNLSRSRYWGTPLPIWSTEDGSEVKCIGSVEEIYREAKKAVEAGLLSEKSSQSIFRPATEEGKSEEAINEEFTVDGNTFYFDPHRPFVDDIVLVSDSGKAMHRVPDVIDVWFDSGAMPYAQWHYPFENKEIFEANFPADFIAEGVDQTRGWFFTLHTLAVMLEDNVAYKNVIANGLVLDKNGNKMSKRIGNVVDPFKTVSKYGPDATRWYMVHNSQPWDNLKFDLEGLDETRRKFFGTLYNVYSFFALYANIDGFKYEEDRIVVAERPEIDRWITSLLNTLVADVKQHMEDYEPTRAIRLIQDFVTDHLSNWYVRLCRRRFWKGDYTQDKISAYQTLYECMETLSKLMAPFAPFYADNLFRDLNKVSQKQPEESVHLAYFPEVEESAIDKDLEERMELAQEVSSLVLSLRKKAKIKVRQPLQKVMIPVLNPKMREQLQQVEELIISEVNVKEIELISSTEGFLVKKAKPDFKKLGPRYGKLMKHLQKKFTELGQEEINELERTGSLEFEVEGQPVRVSLDEVEIQSEDIPGWLVAGSSKVTVALDVTITEELRHEGLAREFVNRVQNLRKEKGFEVTDHILLKLKKEGELAEAIQYYKGYICSETLADELSIVDSFNGEQHETIEVDEFSTEIQLKKNTNG